MFITPYLQHLKKQSIIAVTVALFFALSLSACSTNYPSSHLPQKKYVNHIVLVWFKETANPVFVEQVIRESYKLKKIPQLKSIQIGRAIPSHRKIVDDSFNIGLHMQFNSVAGMYAYLKHPKHVAFVKRIKPHIKKIRVYDF